jgi:hypothetical protein
VEKALTAAQKHAHAACGRAAVAVPQSIQMLQHSAGDAAVAILLSAIEFERQAVAAMVVQRNGGGGEGRYRRLAFSAPVGRPESWPWRRLRTQRLGASIVKPNG